MLPAFRVIKYVSGQLQAVLSSICTYPDSETRSFLWLYTI